MERFLKMLNPEKVTLLLIASNVAIKAKENNKPQELYEVLCDLNRNPYLMQDENMEKVVIESLEEILKVFSSTNLSLDDTPLWRETQQKIYKNIVDVIVSRVNRN